MRARLSIGLAGAAALLISGVFVGVSYGRGDGIVEPEVIELSVPFCGTDDADPQTDCHVYPLRDDEGVRSGSIARYKTVVRDADGTVIGREFTTCDDSVDTDSICTVVVALRAGPYTEAGNVVLVSGGPRPFAVVGGTGAYQNVRGTGAITPSDGGFDLTLSLIP